MVELELVEEFNTKALWELCVNPSVQMSVETRMAKKLEFSRLNAAIKDPNLKLYLARDPRCGANVGSISFRRKGVRRWEIHVAFLQKQVARGVYAKSAILRAIEKHKRENEFPAITAEIPRCNRPALQLAYACGFRRCGIFHSCWELPTGLLSDIVLLEWKNELHR